MYSFDLAVSGREGVEEVQVDAATGKVVSVKHEDAQSEAAEIPGDDALVDATFGAATGPGLSWSAGFRAFGSAEIA